MTAYLNTFFPAAPLAATLLVAIAIGQVGAQVSGKVKTLAFALFMLIT